jgi:O-antigen/teichoic acid export membrane protein
MENVQGAAVAKSDIRLQYSGFVIFAAKLISIATGLFFQFLVAQSTTNAQYDIWFNTSDVLAYFTLMSSVAPFWVMRFVARRREGAAKTGFMANLIIALVSTVAYLALIPFILSSLGISFSYLPLYLIVAFQIAEMYSLILFESCLQATVPQTIGYGLLVQQVGKVALGYVLITQTGQPLTGAIIATTIAFAVQMVYYYRLLTPIMKEPVHWGYVKQWLKGSVANIYNVIGAQIAAYVFIMLYDMGGEGARGRYGVAAQISNIISYSSFLAFALYPKLLADKKSEDVTISLKMVLMFAIPMTAVAIVMSGPYVTLLRPDYPDASIILAVLALDTLVTVISGIFSYVLFGMERLDEKARISFKELAKSKLFVAFSLPYVRSAITLPLSYYILTVYAFEQPLTAALSVSIISVVARASTFTILVSLVRKMIKIDIPWKSIGKYVLAAAATAAVLLVLPHSAIPATATSMEKIFSIAQTLILTVVGGVTYLAILMAIDKEARTLPKAILREIRGKKSLST